MDEDFPQFKRSPRIIKREPTDKVEVKDPPAKPEKKKGAWMTILMPLVMVCVTVALGVFMKRGWMVLMSATMMMASAAFAVVRIVNEKKDTKEKLKNRERDYQEYLLHIRKRLHGLFQAQKESLLYHNPDVPEIEKMVREHSGRIYEHASNDADFLCVSLGKSVTTTSYTVSYSNDALKDSDDELLQEMRKIVDRFTTIPGMPNVVDLKKSHLAYVGEKENIHIQLKAFFAEGTDISAWDCLVGCSDGLAKMKELFNKGRNKTNLDEIYLPYRNGILHGRDLNYGNEFVSCKCVSLMFAVADWMNMKDKDSEEVRKAKFEKEKTPRLFLNL